MLNQFLSYVYSPKIHSEIYHGFLYNRGCKSWWENTLWTHWYNLHDYLSEVDITSGFPNCSLLSLKDCLRSDGLIPTKVINLLIHHLRSPLKESSHFPTLITYIENKENKNWRQGYRSLHMGLGISPILFVILLIWTLKRIQLWNEDLKFKWYALDGCLSYNLRGLKHFLDIHDQPYLPSIIQLLQGKEPLIEVLNSMPLLKESGIKFCLHKSKIVKYHGLWINPLNSLGLSLLPTENLISQFLNIYFELNIPWDLTLKGNTRGKGSKPPPPQKGIAGTRGSQTTLGELSAQGASQLNLSILKNQLKRYFGLIQSKLYASESLNPQPPPLKGKRKKENQEPLDRRLTFTSFTLT